MQRSGLILLHAARHYTAKLLEFTTLRGAVGLTSYAARLPSLAQTESHVNLAPVKVTNAILERKKAKCQFSQLKLARVNAAIARHALQKIKSQNINCKVREIWYKRCTLTINRKFLNEKATIIHYHEEH